VLRYSQYSGGLTNFVTMHRIARAKPSVSVSEVLRTNAEISQISRFEFVKS